MSEHRITATGEDKGYSVTYPVIIGKVRGVTAAYAPGGWSIGIMPPGRSGRRETGGRLVRGPWGYLYGRAAIIDTHGGTAREAAEAQATGRYIDEVGAGDVLIIDGTRYVLSASPYGDVRLDPVLPPADPLHDLIAAATTAADMLARFTVDESDEVSDALDGLRAALRPYTADEPDGYTADEPWDHRARAERP